MVFQDPMTSLEPGGQDRSPAHRVPHPEPRDVEEGSQGARHRRPAVRRHPVGRAPLRRVPAPALRRHAPAGRHRDRPGVRPQAALRRRAHHRPRRHRAGADPRPAPGAAARAVHGDDPRHPRPRRGRQPDRRDRGHVRRPDRREGADPQPVLGRAHALHRGAAQLHPEAHRPEPHPAAGDRRAAPGPRSHRPPAAASRRAARTCRTSAGRRCPRWSRTRPGHQYRCWFPVDVSVAVPEPADRPAVDFEAGTGRLDQAAPKQKLFEPRPTARRED